MVRPPVCPASWDHLTLFCPLTKHVQQSVTAGCQEQRAKYANFFFFFQELQFFFLMIHHLSRLS